MGNGNNPTEWQEGTAWQDNLGALFTHAGQSETIYSTTTVDTTISGTTTIDYWAQVPGASVLHATRDVVIKGAANDNGISSPTASTRPPSANDNQVSSTPPAAIDNTTTSTATSTAQ
jgi:hypothetical protein